ncbi:MAG: ABC transporter permease, partial [Rhodothermales bacterium]
LGFQGTFQLPSEAGSGIGFFEFLFPGIVALIILFTAIFSTISIVEERKSGFLQGALIAPVSRTSLVLGNTLGGTTLALFEAALFLLFVPLIGITITLPGLAIVIVAAFCLGLTFTALGVLIAWRMETTRGFHAVMNLFLLPLWFLSGSFFPLEGAPQILQWIIRINPVSHAVSAIRHGLYYPEAPALVTSSPAVSLVVSVLTAAIMVAVTTSYVRRPLFAR